MKVECRLVQLRLQLVSIYNGGTTANLDILDNDKRTTFPHFITSFQLRSLEKDYFNIPICYAIFIVSVKPS